MESSQQARRADSDLLTALRSCHDFVPLPQVEPGPTVAHLAYECFLHFQENKLLSAIPAET